MLGCVAVVGGRYGLTITERASMNIEIFVAHQNAVRVFVKLVLVTAWVLAPVGALMFWAGMQ